MRWDQPGEYVGPALVLYLQFGIDRLLKNEHVFMTGETFEDGEFIQTSAESIQPYVKTIAKHRNSPIIYNMKR